MINKLTGEPVSEEMQNVLKRLAVNEAVPESEIYALKEIKEANSCISSSKPTIELRNRTGIQLGVYNRFQNMGSAVTKSDGATESFGRCAVIVFFAPSIACFSLPSTSYFMNVAASPWSM